VRESLLVFVVPPSLEALEARLRARRTETPEQIERRFRDAAAELARKDEYDHVVVNETGQIGRTAEQIDAIIAAEHARFPDRRIRL
jgi:guanylate kinase